MHDPSDPECQCAPQPLSLSRYITQVLRLLVASAERGEPCPLPVPLAVHPPPPQTPPTKQN